MANFKNKKEAEEFLNTYKALYDASKSDFDDDVSFCILGRLQVYKHIEYLAKLLEVELKAELFESSTDRTPMIKRYFDYDTIEVFQISKIEV